MRSHRASHLHQLPGPTWVQVVPGLGEVRGARMAGVAVQLPLVHLDEEVRELALARAFPAHRQFQPRVQLLEGKVTGEIEGRGGRVVHGDSVGFVDTVMTSVSPNMFHTQSTFLVGP